MSVGIGLPDSWWGGLPLWGRVAGGVLTAVLWTSSPFILYLVVEAIAVGVSRAAHAIARAAMLLLMLPALIVNTVDALAQALNGCVLVPIAPGLANITFASSQLVIIAFFVLSYARTKGLDKQRLRWVFWAFLISRTGVLLNLLNRLAIHPLHLSGFEWVTVMIFPAGCAYAILRHRIIDVNFVLNRTLVFTILTSFVVGIFILLEDLLKAFAAGRGVGFAVELGVALALGFSFNAVHKYVEGVIERALFRAKHDAANLMRGLADEAAFMESADALLARVMRDVGTAMGSGGVSVYERADNGYRLTCTQGAGSPAESVDVDDLAFVRMRKSRSPVRLGDVQSALGTDGIVFPFTVRGALTGALVCRGGPTARRTRRTRSACSVRLRMRLGPSCRQYGRANKGRCWMRSLPERWTYTKRARAFPPEPEYRRTFPIGFATRYRYARTVNTSNMRVSAISTALAERIRTDLRDEFGHKLNPQIIDGDAPCRHCLRVAPPGEKMILFSYRPFETDHGPYSETGPVFIHAAKCERYDGAGIPPDFASRELDRSRIQHAPRNPQRAGCLAGKGVRGSGSVVCGSASRVRARPAYDVHVLRFLHRAHEAIRRRAYGGVRKRASSGYKRRRM